MADRDHADIDNIRLIHLQMNSRGIKWTAGELDGNVPLKKEYSESKASEVKECDKRKTASIRSVLKLQDK